MEILKLDKTRTTEISEKIKVILKFDQEYLYRMFFASGMDLSELAIFAESIAHLQFNSQILGDYAIKGKAKFEEAWKLVGNSILQSALISPNRKFYHDNVIAVTEVFKYLNQIEHTYSFETQILFSILVTQTKKIL